MKSQKNNLVPNTITRVAEGTVITGATVRSTCDIRIDGEFEGSIDSEARVIIGEKASVKADIRCLNLDIWGTLVGDVTVQDTLTLKSESALTGNVRSSRLVIELGARFAGSNETINR